MDTIGIGDLEETLLEELRSAVSDLTIALHLTESQTSVTRTTLHGLSVEDLNGTSSSRVDLVVDHVLETLVVGWSEEHLRVDLAACEPVVHDLVAAKVVVVAL